MIFGTRNWIEEAGVTVAYTGTSYPSNTILSSAQVGNVWRAQTTGTVSFTLGTSRSINSIAIVGVTHGVAGGSVAVEVRSGGSGGTIVYSSSLGLTLNADGLYCRAVSFTAVTGDWISFSLTSLTAPIDVRRFWVGKSIVTSTYYPSLSWQDTSPMVQGRNGAIQSTQVPIKRRFQIRVHSVEDRLSLGLAATEIDLVTWQNALAFAGGLPLALLDLVEFGFDRAFIGRILSASIQHVQGPHHVVDLVVGDAT